MSRRPPFIDPFLLACRTSNSKLAASGVVCLQRLVISKGLPKARLSEALGAFNACSDLGLDIQLKILQALPSLLQNYADDLVGDLLAGALQVCASLQNAKAHTVSGVAAATLQQLVTAVFEKAVIEDSQAVQVATVAEVPGDDGPVALRPAAYDAYRMFRDLVLTVDERKTKFVDLSSLSPDASLELLWSSLHANEQLFESHGELQSIIRSSLLPTVIRPLSEKLAFPLTLRSLRILDLLLRRSLLTYRHESEFAIGLMTLTIDSDLAPSWKRALVMEVIRNIFNTGDLVLDAYVAYDRKEGGRSIVQDLFAAFVRLSSEKPAAIGLGQQFTLPNAQPPPKDSGSIQSTVEAAGGMAGVISSAFGVADSSAAGISLQRSVPRTACLDQLDKTDPPAVPSTYIYTLVLECLNSFSEALAKVVLPLTVQHDERPSSNGHDADKRPTSRTVRSQSFRRRAVPLNPMDVESSTSDRVHAVAALITDCWPAVLATSSTFLNAALHEQYYRALIKSYQRFAQVAGLLRLITPRDALMTTLGKAAVPPHVLNASNPESVRSPSTESPRLSSNPKGLPSSDSLVSPPSSSRRFSTEQTRPMLTTRNLLCLRALLNLAIALGPTLGTAFSVVIDVLRQADMILSSTIVQQWLRDSSKPSQKASDSPAAVQAFGAEVAAVETAASRFMESTADYPNDSFLTVLETFCGFMAKDGRDTSLYEMGAISPPATPTLGKRTFSGLPGISAMTELQERDYRFVIPKLGSLAEINISRFTTYDVDESGWTLLVDTLADIASSSSRPVDARRAATEVLCKLSAGTVSEVSQEDSDTRATVQRQALAVLSTVISGIYEGEDELTSTDTEVQGYVLDALRAILERTGDSLVGGWDQSIAILSSAFERSERVNNRLGEEHGVADDTEDVDKVTRVDWSILSHDLVSPGIGRTAFAATQLICSDFQSSLPSGVITSLIELLFRFICQTDDLNIALTSITMAWAVADYLFQDANVTELDALDIDFSDMEEVESTIALAAPNSRAAQWMFLHFRLRDSIEQSTSNEVRNAAFQAIYNSFKTHGDKLTADIWNLCLRAIMLRIEAADAARYMQDEDGRKESRTARQNESLSQTIIKGTSEVVAQHISLIEQIAKLPSLWEMFLSKLEAYMDVGLNAAAFSALARVLLHIDRDALVWSAPAYRTLSLWLKRLPEAASDSSDRQGDQDAYVAYADTATEVYRLTKHNLGTSQLRRVIDNLYSCVQHSHGPSYSADVDAMSSLQAKVLNLLKAMEPNTQMIASSLVTVAAQLSLLHHDTNATDLQKGSSSIALASASIDWLHNLFITCLREELLDASAVLTGLHSLRRIIAEKYAVPAECKGVSLWRKATDAVVKLSGQTLQLEDRSYAIVTEYVGIAKGVVDCHGLSSAPDPNKVYEDQLADIESFESLRGLLVTRLSEAGVPDDVRLEYCRALFDASIVHATEPREVPGPDESPLVTLGKIRRGRARLIRPSQRERMSYTCFSELVQLASKRDGNPQTKLAQAAAPLLILRLAIPIRGYIADQSLRGSRPQPLSELEELLFCFTQTQSLQLDPDALTTEPGMDDRKGRKAHLHFLYPLLAKAVATAGDKWFGAEEVLKPLQSLLESINPVP